MLNFYSFKKFATKIQTTAYNRYQNLLNKTNYKFVLRELTRKSCEENDSDDVQKKITRNAETYFKIPEYLLNIKERNTQQIFGILQ